MYYILIPTTQVNRAKTGLNKYPITFEEKLIIDPDGKSYFTKLFFDVSYDEFAGIATFVRKLGVDAYGIDIQLQGPPKLMQILKTIK